MKKRNIDLFKAYINALETKSEEQLIAVIGHMEKEKVTCKDGMIELMEEIQGYCRDILEGRENEAKAI